MRNLFNSITPLRRWWKDIKASARFGGYKRAIRNELRYSMIFRRLFDLKYWIEFRTFRKYHVLKLHTKPGYSDVTERLIHANFCLLSEFVEKERPFESTDWSTDNGHIHAAKEIKELYYWWKNVYPNYDKNDPINQPHVKCPEHISNVMQVDSDGDPELYSYTKQFQDPKDEDIWHKACLDSHAYEERTQQEIQINLMRLIQIRQYLWT